MHVCGPERFDRLEFVLGEEAQVDCGEGALTWLSMSVKLSWALSLEAPKSRL